MLHPHAPAPHTWTLDRPSEAAVGDLRLAGRTETQRLSPSAETLDEGQLRDRLGAERPGAGDEAQQRTVTGQELRGPAARRQLGAPTGFGAPGGKE